MIYRALAFKSWLGVKDGNNHLLQNITSLRASNWFMTVISLSDGIAEIATSGAFITHWI
jgi:hypothetical protein